MKNIEIKKGTVLYANTGVAVKVLEYSSKFGGRVLVERADGIEGGKPMWRPLDKFSETNPYPQKNKGGKVDNKNITDFINGYKMGILFTETDEEGENLDANYNPSNFDSKSDEIISKMAHQYIDENGASIILSKLSYEQIGTDVWFAQSGQGAGFFDRGLSKGLEKKLTDGAKKFSNLSAYVFVQDGKVYIEGLKFENGGYLPNDEWKKGTTIKFKTKKQAQERLNLMKGEKAIKNPRIEKIWDKPFVDKINDGYVVKFEYLKSDKYAKGGKLVKFKKGDKVLTRDGKVETVIRKNSNGNIETEENDYSHNPSTLKLFTPKLEKNEANLVIIYDNGGKSFDRYTVFTPDGSVYGMSENGIGFNQYIGDSTEIEKGSHLGKKLKSIPKEIKQSISDRMKEFSKGSTIRANKSSLLKYVNFEDNWHINLLELNPNRNNNGLKYKNKNQYAVVRSTKEKGQEIFEFKTLSEAEERFEKLVEKSKTYSKVVSEGKTNNYEKGGSMPKSFEYSIGGL